MDSLWSQVKEQERQYFSNMFGHSKFLTLKNMYIVGHFGLNSSVDFSKAINLRVFLLEHRFKGKMLKDLDLYLNQKQY